MMPGVNLLEKFEEEFNIPIAEIIADAQLDDNGRADVDDYPVINMYNEFLYKNAPESDEDEDMVIQDDTFHEVSEHFESELVTALESRREKTLAFAIQTFNKI
jgi:hypothetical protein